MSKSEAIGLVQLPIDPDGRTVTQAHKAVYKMIIVLNEDMTKIHSAAD